jgi:hypothetical protein
MVGTRSWATGRRTSLLEQNAVDIAKSVKKEIVKWDYFTAQTQAIEA